MVCNETIQKEENIIRLKNSDIQAHNSFITKLHEELQESQEIVDSAKIKLYESELQEYKDERLQYVEQRKYYDILGTILNDKGIFL